MSFKKKNAVISSPGTSQPSSSVPAKPGQLRLADGLRPSPLDGRLTTSTGTSSLDDLLACHAGFPLGTSLLVEEHGTTDFAGTLLRNYAAEGLVQGHHVHVLGFSEAWKYELPAATEAASSAIPGAAPKDGDKMKIAWRYEALASRPAQRPGQSGGERQSDTAAIFCHTFDMAKRLSTSSMRGSLHAVPCPNALSLDPPTAGSPLRVFIGKLQVALQNTSAAVIHRVVVPSLLSPTLYPAGSSHPSEVLQFLHSLRALLRQHSDQLTAMITLPVSLFPRALGLVRWMELLCDGVIELIPLPPAPEPEIGGAGDHPDSKKEMRSQGMLRVHSLPVYHEKGGGGGSATAHFRENLSFSLSSSRGLVIKPYSLPPLSDESQKEKSPASTVKDGLDF